MLGCGCTRLLRELLVLLLQELAQELAPLQQEPVQAMSLLPQEPVLAEQVPLRVPLALYSSQELALLQAQLPQAQQVLQHSVLLLQEPVRFQWPAAHFRSSH